MPERKLLILVGGGGHCKSCIDVIELEDHFTIAGVVDLKEKLHQNVLTYRIIACDDDLPKITKEYTYFLITFGQIKTSEKRRDMFEYLKTLGVIFPTIISPLAYVSKHARIDEGTIIMHNAFINANTSIGKNCIINTGAIIEHDVKIGNHCHISTSSVINGGCSVGEETFFGSNSVLKHEAHICSNVIIGAGSVVVKSIHEEGTYVGNPVKKIR